MPYYAIRDPDQIQALLDAVVSIESELDLAAVLRRIVEAARTLTGAKYAALGVIDPSGTGLSEFVHVGMDDATAKGIGQLPLGEGILGLLIVDPAPLRLANLSTHPDAGGFPPGHPPMRSFLGVPLRVRDEVFGNLYLTEREGAAEFTEEDEELVLALAVAAGIAIYNSRLLARIGELGLVADRERIARDLHDTVIQRLFATGLSLQSVLPVLHDPEVRSRVEDAVSDLDDTISQVRTTIFALEPPPTAETGVRARVLKICSEEAKGLGFEPEVRFVGAVDRYVDAAVATELLPTLREALSNVVRHAGAHHVEVDLSAGDQVRLRVTDDGRGIDPRSDRGGRTGRGLPNMAGRAESLGGTMRLSGRPKGGTELLWLVPVSPTDDPPVAR